MEGRDFVRRVLLFLIVFYRKAVSPYKRACCRFEPTCSQYAYTAIQRFGVLKGCYLTLRRILKCHPFHAGGYDPVPENICVSHMVEEN